MGVYYYHMHGRPITATLNGERVTVGKMKWMCKSRDLSPSLFGLPEADWKLRLRKRITALEEAWATREVPAYFVIGDTIKEGDLVSSNPNGDTRWHDCNELPGKVIGRLIRKGGRWAIGPIVKE